jgi:hypothetical protein
MYPYVLLQLSLYSKQRSGENFKLKIITVPYGMFFIFIVHSNSEHTKLKMIKTDLPEICLGTVHNMNFHTVLHGKGFPNFLPCPNRAFQHSTYRRQREQGFYKLSSVADPDPHWSAFILVGWIRIRIVIRIRIRIQDGRNDPQK